MKKRFLGHVSLRFNERRHCSNSETNRKQSGNRLDVATISCLTALDGFHVSNMFLMRDTTTTLTTLIYTPETA